MRKTLVLLHIFDVITRQRVHFKATFVTARIFFSLVFKWVLHWWCISHGTDELPFADFQF